MDLDIMESKLANISRVNILWVENSSIAFRHSMGMTGVMIFANLMCDN